MEEGGEGEGTGEGGGTGEGEGWLVVMLGISLVMYIHTYHIPQDISTSDNSNTKTSSYNTLGVHITSYVSMLLVIILLMCLRMMLDYRGCFKTEFWDACHCVYFTIMYLCITSDN